MNNLAGNKECDKDIEQELKEAGIIRIRHDKPIDHPEVKASTTGTLVKDGEITFKFFRAWCYWVVSGSVPLDVARILYSTDIGKKDVRVAGHCGCPPPEEWAFPKDEVLYELGVYKKPSEEHPYGDSPTYGELAEMCNSGKIQEQRFVSSYHIDSQEGLNFFVAILKENVLVD